MAYNQFDDLISCVSKIVESKEFKYNLSYSNQLKCLKDFIKKIHSYFNYTKELNHESSHDS